MYLFPIGQLDLPPDVLEKSPGRSWWWRSRSRRMNWRPCRRRGICCSPSTIQTLSKCVVCVGSAFAFGDGEGEGVQRVCHFAGRSSHRRTAYPLWRGPNFGHFFSEKNSKQSLFWPVSGRDGNCSRKKKCLKKPRQMILGNLGVAKNFCDPWAAVRCGWGGVRSLANGASKLSTTICRRSPQVTRLVAWTKKAQNNPCLTTSDHGGNFGHPG